MCFPSRSVFPDLPIVSGCYPLCLSSTPVTLLSESSVVSLASASICSVNTNMSASFTSSIFTSIPRRSIILRSRFPPATPVAPATAATGAARLDFPLFFLLVRLLLLVILFTALHAFCTSCMFYATSFTVLYGMQLFIMFLFCRFGDVLWEFEAG